MATTKKLTSLDTQINRANKAAATRKANQERKARMDKIMEALNTEQAQLNEAINNGVVIILKTFAGDYQIDGVDANFDYHSHPAGSRNDYFNTRTWSGCNDSKWADLLRQANIQRHSFFA
jgi:hypothetical protein